MGVAAADGTAAGVDRADPPLLALRLWPHRSLSRAGAGWVLGAVALGLAAPLAPLAGTPVGWGLLPFLVAALVGLYAALRRSYADGGLVEEVRLWPDLIAVERREPRGGVRRWQANPYWVRLALVEGAHVEHYLTLAGAGREIELGAFLSPEERLALHRELDAALAALRARCGDGDARALGSAQRH